MDAKVPSLRVLLIASAVDKEDFALSKEDFACIS